MKTPSSQEAAKTVEEIAKSCIVYDDEEGCYISASRCRIETALLEADKNGYERGRKEMIEAISDVIGEHQEESELEMMRAVVQYLDKASLALRKTMENKIKDWIVEEAEIMRQRLLVADLGECKRLSENALRKAYERGKKAELERARNYTGVEGHPCPLCVYDNGVFVRSCVPHQQLHEAIREASKWGDDYKKLWEKMSGRELELNTELSKERARLDWLDQNCAFVADDHFKIGPFKTGELRKMADAGLEAQKLLAPSDSGGEKKKSE